MTLWLLTTTEDMVPSSLEAWPMALYPRKVRRDWDSQSSISRFEQVPGWDVMAGGRVVTRVVVTGMVDVGTAALC
jgi:hypothetical protein